MNRIETRGGIDKADTMIDGHGAGSLILTSRGGNVCGKTCSRRGKRAVWTGLWSRAGTAASRRCWQGMSVGLCAFMRKTGMY